MRHSFSNASYFAAALLTATIFMAGCSSMHGHAEAPAASAAPVQRAVCLPCGDDVDVTANTAKTTYNGKTYYFCSAKCKAAFEKDPAKYADAK